MTKETRSDRRKRRNRQAIIDAAYGVMSEKGVDATTMHEIAEAADVGSGTTYNYFLSKDELAVAVIEHAIRQLAKRIEIITNEFRDPGQIYAVGIRNVMIAISSDSQWRSLLRRSEIVARAMYRVMGPYAIRDIKNAVAAGRYKVENPELAWWLATHAIVGLGIAASERKIDLRSIDETMVDLLGMVGVSREEAWKIARPNLPKDEPCPYWTPNPSRRLRRIA